MRNTQKLILINKRDVIHKQRCHVQWQSKDNPQNNLSEQFSKDEIRFALDKLPTHYKEVIELRFFQNFNINETAQIMRKNSITVRVWQHRAIKQLEQIYKDNE